MLITCPFWPADGRLSAAVDLRVGPAEEPAVDLHVTRGVLVGPGLGLLDHAVREPAARRVEAHQHPAVLALRLEADEALALALEGHRLDRAGATSSEQMRARLIIHSSRTCRRA